MHFNFLSRILIGVIGLTSFTQAAQASCGAAFCAINTQWNSQGIWTEPGWRTDLRYEYIPQDQPRAGSQAVNVGEIPSHHDEVKTINQNLIATLDYGFANGWGITASLPLVDRYHLHIHNHHGEKLIEKWDFTALGDVQIMGRYQFNNWNQPYVFGIYFGAKLPTGQFDITNKDNDRAERSLQPGTGTTDALLGFYTRYNLPSLNSSFFAQLIAQMPLNERAGYQPGQRISMDLGYRYDMTDRLSLMLQLNGQYKWRDKGVNAEPEDSGSRTISVSTGLSYGVTKTLQLYGFVQAPVYQHVNGVQLTSGWSVVTGASLHF